MEPFLRWAGGKRWIAPTLAPLLKPILTGRLIEPFLGSGALFFSMAPKAALLGDLNRDLINVYRQVARHATRIEDELAMLKVDQPTYNAIRDEAPESRIDAAIRFIYLNRTCFGGLHRTNKQGRFNVPFGGGTRTPEPLYRDHLLLQAGVLLRRKNVKLFEGDFSLLMDRAECGDIAFCDPTYRSVGRHCFDRYGPVIFSWDDHVRLTERARVACRRGALVLIMNVDHPEVLPLYADARVFRVSRTKSIGNKSRTHTSQREVVAVFDPLQRHALWDTVEAALWRFVPPDCDVGTPQVGEGTSVGLSSRPTNDRPVSATASTC